MNTTATGMRKLHLIELLQKHNNSEYSRWPLTLVDLRRFYERHELDVLNESRDNLVGLLKEVGAVEEEQEDIFAGDGPVKVIRSLKGRQKIGGGACSARQEQYDEIKRLLSILPVEYEESGNQLDISVYDDSSPGDSRTRRVTIFCR